MKKVAILFGAGAEVCFGISGGRDFALKVLGEGVEPMNLAIKNYYKNTLPQYNHADWYPSFKTTNWNKGALARSAIKKQLLENIRDLKKKEFDALVKERVEYFLLEENAQEYQKLLDDYTSYMGLLDGRFHTLISPKVLGPQKFWDVVTCYTRAYLLILGEMISQIESCELNEQKYLMMLQNPMESWDKAKDFCRHVKKLGNKENYYSILSRKAEKNIKVITTNYTPLCKEISGFSSDNIAHIHGRMNWFESPYNLQVYDVEQYPLPNELCFPYIFIQSGIKPIVDTTQLKENEKMLRFLQESERLIVVGFRLNSDDNHINGIIRGYLSDKEVVYLDFDNNSSIENIYKKLRIDSSNNLIYEKINATSCYKIFDKYLE